MRKQIISPEHNNLPGQVEGWLPLEEIAQVDITSEEADHPVELALLPKTSGGWRASAPGAQLLRLHFDTPQRLQKIRLHFVELEVERTQEFVLRASHDNGRTYSEIVRQQWNFSPSGSVSELEEYHVDLTDVTTLELTMVPDISGGNAYATLAELRVA